jgi:hypothetical protein
VSVCLALLVKNAEGTVERCIKSSLPFIDRWLVIDTGSTDGTKDVTRAALGDLPGKLLEREWVRFDVNRSELLREARASGADYTLMLDADMELAGRIDTTKLTSDEYLIEIHDRGMIYPLPLLTSNSKAFFYAGAAHACLNCEDQVTIGRIRGLWVIDHGGGPGTDGKFERDRVALEAEVLKNPNDTRSWFYLAQTYRDLDLIPQAVEAYKHRAMMAGFDEEIYWSLYQAGVLTCAHVSFLEGAQILLKAWALRPHRAEALRALAGCSNAVANKIPFPTNDVLFIEREAYAQPSAELEIVTREKPTLKLEISLDVGTRSRPRITRARGLDHRDVSAVLVTRGNVDMAPILETLPFRDVIIWDNSRRPVDLKLLGRYAAVPETRRPVIYWQDDDVILTREQISELLREYEPGKVLVNMDAPWVEACGYDTPEGLVGMMGAGSLCPAELPQQIFDHYLEHYPLDDDLLIEADFAFGVLAPTKRVDVGYVAREFADDVDRLYRQPGQQKRKWEMIRRCQAML